MKRMVLTLAALLALNVTVLAAGETPANETCPVMAGNKVNPKLFVEYKGKKVYFCCADCKGAFLKEPEKYLSRLPQFAGLQSHDEHGEDHDHAHGLIGSFSPARLIKPTGIVALALLFLVACAGFFMRKKPRFLRKAHKGLAVAAIVFALIHALLVVLFH